MKRRSIIIAVASVALGVVWGFSFAAGPAEKDPAMLAFMRQKLAYTQGITEGLTLEKLDLVSKNAVKLRDMTQTNVWTRVHNAEYGRLTKDYQASVEALFKAGNEGYLKPATDAYVKVLKNCLECHQALRAETVTGRK